MSLRYWTVLIEAIYQVRDNILVLDHSLDRRARFVVTDPIPLIRLILLKFLLKVECNKNLCDKNLRG